MRMKIKEISRRANWILHVTFVLGLLNFFVFWCGAIYLGGDALNGYVHAQHYFVCAHGACHQVTETIWKYSYWHAISAEAGIFLTFVELAIFINTGDITPDFDADN